MARLLSARARCHAARDVEDQRRALRHRTSEGNRVVADRGGAEAGHRKQRRRTLADQGEEAGLADVRGAEGAAVHVDSPFLLLLLQALLRAVVRL